MTSNTKKWEEPDFTSTLIVYRVGFMMNLDDVGAFRDYLAITRESEAELVKEVDIYDGSWSSLRIDFKVPVDSDTVRAIIGIIGEWVASYQRNY